MRIFVTLCLSLSLALPSAARADDHSHDHGDHDHDSHVSASAGMTVTHAWTQARRAGEDALIFMEISNATDRSVNLDGGEALGRPLEVVVFSYGAQGESWTVIEGGTGLSAGTDFAFVPRVAALMLRGLSEDLPAGGTLELTVLLDGTELPVTAEIGARNATAHSHAGHAH